MVFKNDDRLLSVFAMLYFVAAVRSGQTGWMC